MSSALPRLMAVTAAPLDVGSLAGVLAGGIELVQVRDKAATDDEVRRLWRDTIEPLRARWPRVVWLLNGRPALAVELGADGVHLPELAPAPTGAAGLVGRSVHGLAAIDRALDEGVDYLVYSPVFAPSCKDVAGVGLAALAEAVGRAGRVPVFALGGMTAARAARSRRRTAVHGVAVMSGLFGAADPEAAARAFVDAVG